MNQLFDEKLKIEIVPNVEIIANTDFEKAIYDLDTEIDLLSSHADILDYIVAASSGVLCGMLDILWVGNFDLAKGRSIAEDKINGFVTKTANLFGYKGDDLKSAVSFLEKMFPLASDGNTPDFGGGLQHHLRDFSHHPTIVGLIFSLLTQFTEHSFGIDKNGNFKSFKVPDKSKFYIGKNIPDKIIKGTINHYLNVKYHSM